MQEHRDFTIYRFGFPVLLKNFPARKVWGEWKPDINALQLRRKVAEALIVKASPLTGQEVYFLRRFLSLTMEELGKKLKVSHAAIGKWEKKEEQPTKMAFPTEFMLRFLVHLHLEGFSPETTGFESFAFRVTNEENYYSATGGNQPLEVSSLVEASL
jgi:DNA-binding transcriptional regulator YiaG